MSKKLLAEIKKRSGAAAFKLEDFCFPEQLEFLKDPSKFKTAVCSRRCLAAGTLVQTTLGPKPIECIKPGDLVYDEHGKEVQVKEVYDNGIQEVVDVLHNRRVLFSATENHKVLTTHSRIKENTTKELKDLYGGLKIVRKEVDRLPGIEVPYAYAIGALLGDGCSREGGTSYISVSSEDALIPNKIGELLSATLVKKCHPKNYTYNIYLDARTLPEEYLLWCHKKYAHEKICDIERVLSWSRESRLAFLAGLLDTDGSVSNLRDGIQIDISMQAKSVIEAAQMLFLDLFNYKPTMRVDRRDKYKNGPVYTIRLKHNYFGKKILMALDPYIQTPRKKWNSDYEVKLENNYNPECVGVKLGNKSVQQTYDIHVNSATNLYMLATGVITHNSGKTVACAADLIHTAISHKEGDVAYITLNRRTAKKIIWRQLLQINKDFQLGGHPDNTELTLTMPHGPVIHVAGAKDESEIQKFLGHPLRKVYIDEAQSFRPYIEELIEDILEPTMIDYDGSIILIGTPGPIPAGYFYDAAHNPDGWKNFKWTMHDNPFIEIKSKKTPEEHVKEICERRGVPITHPSIQREFFGQWVYDAEGLVFQFNPKKNIYKQLPEDKLEYIFGVDVGYDDADAIAVLGYSYVSKNVYLVEEDIARRQDITTLANRIKYLKEKYNPVKIVIDSGGLGKKLNEEIRVRHGLVMEAADKHRKFEFIELLNDDLRTAKLKAFEGSKFEQDCYLEQWDRSKPGKLKMSDTYHSDINMAVLYGWRECKHYFAEPTVARLSKNSDAYMDALEAKEAKAMEDSLKPDDGGPSQDDLNYVFGDTEDF